MSKIFAEVFPFLDYLYIFQSLEYERISFLRWFLRHPFQRLLQRKHHLDLTSKALMLTINGFVLLTISAGLVSYLATSNFLFTPIFLILFSTVSPLFLLISSIFIYPLDWYSKRKILNSSFQKITRLNELLTIAIVGSYAKTSAKDILDTLLWKDFMVVKTPKSYNTELSLARTINEYLKPNTQIFIAEMDAYHRSEINHLCQLTRPKYGIITAIAPQHLERFGSMENLAHTQFELVENLPEEGKFFLNTDDELIVKLYKEKPINAQTITYGIGPKNHGLKNNFYITDIKIDNSGTIFTLHTLSGHTEIHIPLFGKHHAFNFLAASAIAYTVGLPLSEIKSRANLIVPTPHRMEIKQSGNLTIIDNTYNTNPQASQAALQLLKEYPGKSKIVITPGIVELGSLREAENKKFGDEIAKVADFIVVVGNYARKPILSGLKESKFPADKILSVATTQQAFDLLPKISVVGSVVLLENDLPDQYS